VGSAIRLTYGSGADDGRSVRAEGERFVIGRDPSRPVEVTVPFD